MNECSKCHAKWDPAVQTHRYCPFAFSVQEIVDGVIGILGLDQNSKVEIEVREHVIKLLATLGEPA